MVHVLAWTIYCLSLQGISDNLHSKKWYIRPRFLLYKLLALGREASNKSCARHELGLAKMKRIVLLMLFVTIGAMCTAQLSPIASISGYLMFSGSDANMYYTYMPTGNTIYVYNWDGSLSKTVSVTPPSGYTIQSVYCLSKKIFNNDDKLEMCVTFHSSSVNNSYYKMWLINENGSKLYDFGNAYAWNCNFISYNGTTHLNAIKGILEANNNLSYTTIIYNCSGPGTVSTQAANHDNITVGSAYPNPSDKTITIPYNLSSDKTTELHIYNIDGTLMNSIPVGPHFNEVSVDVSTFPSGIYIYECDGRTNKFIVK